MSIEYDDNHRKKTMFNRISSALKRRNAYNRTCRELSMLSDRELNDLGISRSEIRAVALTGARSI